MKITSAIKTKKVQIKLDNRKITNAGLRLNKEFAKYECVRIALPQRVNNSNTILVITSVPFNNLHPEVQSVIKELRSNHYPVTIKVDSNGLGSKVFPSAFEYKAHKEEGEPVYLQKIYNTAAMNDMVQKFEGLLKGKSVYANQVEVRCGYDFLYSKESIVIHVYNKNLPKEAADLFVEANKAGYNVSLKVVSITTDKLANVKSLSDLREFLETNDFPISSKTLLNWTKRMGA